MAPSLTHLQLIPAMQQPGCPICRIRYEREKRYLENLLLEHVNDAETRNNLIASVGYCPSHTWQMCFLELLTYHDTVKNSMIYEYLVKSVSRALAQYHRQEQFRVQGINGWFRRMLRKEKPAAFAGDPFAPMIFKGCHICQVGEQAERLYLSSLMQGVCAENDKIREEYQSSDGLCLYHFRRAFSMSDPKFNAALKFLVEATIQKMNSLGSDLTGFIDKHAWDRCHEQVSDGEDTSWLRAMRFFGGNEENTFLEVNEHGSRD